MNFFKNLSLIFFFFSISSCSLFESKVAKIKKLELFADSILKKYPEGEGPKEEFKKAYEACYNAYLMDSLNQDAILGCGCTAYRLKDYNLAIYYLTKLNKIHPNKEAYRIMGRCEDNSGNLDLAEKDYNIFLNMDSTSYIAAYVYFFRACVLQKKGSLPEAIVSFTKAIDTDSSKDDFFINRGELYYHMSQLRNAYFDFKFVLSRDSANIWALSGMGEVLISGQRVREGMEYEYKAILIDPTNGVFYRNLGIGYYFMHNMDSFCIEMHKSVLLGAQDDEGYIERFCKQKEN